MIHSSSYAPNAWAVLLDSGRTEIDRVQDMTIATTLNRTKVEEVGRDGNVAWRKQTPSVNLTLRQLEYGNMAFYRTLANKGDSVTTINLTDFSTSLVDIAAYKTDDTDTFLGTVYCPNFRMSAMSLNIGDPDAVIERNFTLIGEDEIELLHDNKYLIYKRAVLSAGDNQTVTLSSPSPVADPDHSGQYLFKVVRTRSGVSTELTHGTDWSYDGTDTLTINGASLNADIIRVWYSASTFISGESMFAANDADLSSISADCVSIYLQDSNYLYKLQSAGIETSFDRTDYKEIGNSNIVQRGIKDITNRITLGRLLEQFTIEEILRGKSGLNYGKINPRNFADNLNLIIKIFSDNTKTTFKMGYKYLNLTPESSNMGITVSDYVSKSVILTGETGLLTTDEDAL